MPQPHTTKVNNLRRLSQLLDNAIPIPISGYRIGIDPILGLLPAPIFNWLNYPSSSNSYWICYCNSVSN